MSTKIYNGIKFKSNNLKEILTQLQSIKKDAKKIGIERLKEKEILNFILFNNLEEEHSIEIVSELQQAIGKSQRTFMEPSFKFSVMVFPHSNGDMYGYYLDDNVPGYSDLLFDNNIAEDFHYQNQSDRPDELTDEEWDEREDIWDELLPGIGVLGDNGFVFTILNEYDCGLASGVRKYIEEVAIPEAKEKRENQELIKKLLSKIPIERIGYTDKKKGKTTEFTFHIGYKKTDQKVTKKKLLKALESEETLDELANEITNLLNNGD